MEVVGQHRVVGARGRRPRARPRLHRHERVDLPVLHRASPGHNLFGGSVIALDVKTGRRKWHFQVHHSEQWNYDIPTAPILMDLTVNGRKIPALVQNTKQGLIFAFNRETGEPIWPIEERPVMQTEVPGNYTSPTQPFPTKPEPLDRIVLDGITDEFVMDYTPELNGVRPRRSVDSASAGCKFRRSRIRTTTVS